MGFLDRWKANQKEKARAEAQRGSSRPVEKWKIETTGDPHEDAWLRPVTVKLGFNDEKFLNQEFQPLKTIRGGLDKDVIHFIRHGKKSQVLNELRERKGGGNAIKLLACVGRYNNWIEEERTRRNYFNATSVRDPLYFFRILKVYEAASFPDEQVHMDWLVRFILEIGALPRSGYWTDNSHDLPISVIEGMLDIAGEDNDKLARISLLREFDIFEDQHYGLGSGMKEYRDYVKRYRNIISDILDQGSVVQKTELMKMFYGKKIDHREFRDATLRFLRQDARSYSMKELEERYSEHRWNSPYQMGLKMFIPGLMDQARSGTAKERSQAVSDLFLLISRDWMTHGAGEVCPRTPQQPYGFFRYLSLTERNAEVRSLIDGFLDELKPDCTYFHPHLQPSLHPEPLPEVNPVTTLPPITKEIILEAIRLTNERKKEYHLKNRKSKFQTPLKLIEESMVQPYYDRMNSYINIGTYSSSDRVDWHLLKEKDGKRLIYRFLDTAGLDVIHILRFLSQFRRYMRDSEALDYYMEKHDVSFELRDVAMAKQALGYNPHNYSLSGTRRYVSGNQYFSCLGTRYLKDPDSVWPFFAEHLHLIIDQLYKEANFENNLFRYSVPKGDGNQLPLSFLTTFPEPPEPMIPVLWGYALAREAVNKNLARIVLERVPGIRDQIVEKFRKGKVEERAGAAEWLADLDPETAKEVLVKGLRKERVEAVKIAIIDCLDRLGIPEEVFLDFQGLKAESERNLKGGIPTALGWFHFSGLPSVHWKDSGALVDPEIIIWFIVQGYKLKKPEPSALLKRYCDHMVKEEKEALGQYVLEHWLQHDTLIDHTEEELHVMALKEIRDFRKQFPGWNVDEDVQYRKLRTSYKISKITGSTIKEKGILAVAAACCGEQAIDPINTYLKTYYGYRAAQCKTLIAVLSWIEHYEATNLLIKTSERFRTPSIRKEAEKYVHLMAERKGWTIDELQERTLPTGGFDENRTLNLDFGPRKFTVLLGKNLNLTIRNEDGKVLKSLPAPGAKDDEELSEEAKKAFNTAKRAVNAVKKRESARLHEAMLTQRTWTYCDWERYLNRHPIASLYIQRMVWAVLPPNDGGEKVEGEQVGGEKVEGERKKEVRMAAQTFRPLEDSSLTDLNDEVVLIDDDSILGIAHTMILSEEERIGWLTHMKDYQISPILDQFPETVRTLEEELENEVMIPSYKGMIINGVKLGRLVKKFGYINGPMDPYDKFLFSYQKKIVGKGMAVNIEFTGKKSYEMDDTIALKNVYFTRAPEEGEDEVEDEHRRIPLNEVPPLLISETLSHMEVVAKECEGHDPDWQKKYDLMSSS